MLYYGPLTSTLRWGTRVQRSGSMSAFGGQNSHFYTTLVTWPISACDSSSPFRISRWSANKAPLYSQKTIFNMASVRHLQFSNLHAQDGNLHLCTKLHRNRIIHGWDMEIKLFSKWRPSAILSFLKLQFWSRVLYWHVILYFQSKFSINRSKWRRDIAKNDFQYGVRCNRGFTSLGLWDMVARFANY